MSSAAVVRARRFLHCCYCCPDAGATSELLREALGLQTTMATSDGKTDGRVLGIDGLMDADVRFAFDHRGPRTSPGIEIQAWIDPPLVGEPYREPNHIGFHAVGIAVGDLDATVADLERRGAATLGAAADGATLCAPRAAVVRAPDGVTIDVVRSGELGGGDTILRHMRVTCSDLDRTVAWYETLGFDAVVRRARSRVPAPLFGLAADGDVEWAQLRLPDEPFSLLLHQWIEPASNGAPYAVANHRGMYRAAICVDDTRAAHRALVERGWVFDAAPELVELSGTPVPDMWIAFVSDPDGIPIELVERPRSAFR